MAGQASNKTTKMPVRPEKLGTDRPPQNRPVMLVMGLVEAPVFWAGTFCAIQNEIASLQS